jgi:Flp pilus assembly protein CpaB
MNRSVQFIIGILAVLLAVGAGIYGRNAYLKEVSTYQVPVPATTIPPYTVLSEAMFKMRDMPRTMENLPYYQSVGDLKGLVTTVALPAGLPIPNANAVPVNQFRLADAAFEVVSIPVEPVSAVGGQIQIGQRVNLYSVIQASPDQNETSSSNDPAQLQTQVERVAGSVLVVDVRTSQGVKAGPGKETDKGSSGLTGSGQQIEQVQILTLALEPGLVDKVLDAVASTKKQGGLLWTTLAIP